MTDARLQIEPSTRVADLLDAYPELEDRLIRMAPPFKKLKIPFLRKSVAKVATLRQAAVAARLDLKEMVDELRTAVGQPPLAEVETVDEASYLGDEPDWFEPHLVATIIDDREWDDARPMAINRVVTALSDLESRQVVELVTTFLPAPGIDVARRRGVVTWSVREEPELVRTYFAKD